MIFFLLNCKNKFTLVPVIMDNCFPRQGFWKMLIWWCQGTFIVHAKAYGVHNMLALYKDRGLETRRCEMSFLSAVCSHPGEAHKADKAKQLFIGGLIQVSVWESCKPSTKLAGC